MTAVKQKFEGDGSDLEKELAKLQREVIKLREENAKTARESVDGSRRQEQANKRYAESVKKDLQGPAEKYREDLKKLEAAYKSGHLTQEEFTAAAGKLEEKMRRNNAEMTKANRVSSNLLSTAMKFGGLAAIWQTATAALQAYIAELERVAAIEASAADAQARHARAQALFVFNTSSLSDEQRQRFEGGVLEAAQRIGFGDLDAAMAGAGAAFSASSGANPEEQMQNALQAVQATMQIARLRPDQFGTFAGASQDISKVSGVSDPRQSLSFLANIMSLMRIEDPNMAKNVVKGISDITATDTRGRGQQSTIEAAAIVAALTQAMVDITGDPSKTAGRQGALQLEKFFADRANDPGTPLGRLRALQASPELGQEFLSGANLGESVTAWRQALDETSEITKTINSNLSNLGNSFELDRFNELSRRMERGTPQIMIAGERARREGEEQTFDLANFGAARRNEARERLDKVLEKHMPESRLDMIIGSIPLVSQFSPSERDKARVLGERQIANSDVPEQAVIDLISQLQYRMTSSADIGAPMHPGMMDIIRQNPTAQTFRAFGIDAQEQEEFMKLEERRRNAESARDRFERFESDSTESSAKEETQKQVESELREQTGLLERIAGSLDRGKLPNQQTVIAQTEQNR